MSLDSIGFGQKFRLSTKSNQTLSYGYESRITQITYPDQSTNSFSYNGLDTRVSKVDSARTRTYLRDGAYATDPVLSDGAAVYTPGISERRSGTTKFYQPDRLGTTERLTDANQSTTDTRQYDAFGLLTSSSGTTPTPFGFAGAWGYQEDPDSGLKLLGHRYYDSSTGRFLTRDPVKDGRNWYGYGGRSSTHPRYNPLVPSEQQFFQEDEAEQILLLAARRSASGAMSRDQLLAAAAEAGISPEAVQEAETEYRERSAEVKERLHFDKHVKHEFWTHLTTYLLVNTGLVFLDLRGDGGLDWAFWPVVGWGLGMIAHAWMTFAKGSDDYEKEFRRWRAKKSLRESGVIDDVAAGIITGVGLGSLGTSLSEDALNQSSRAARRALRQERKARIEQRKLEAIEHLRAKTGLSLPEAKQVVEEYLEEIEE